MSKVIVNSKIRCDKEIYYVKTNYHEQNCRPRTDRILSEEPGNVGESIQNENTYMIARESFPF